MLLFAILRIDCSHCCFLEPCPHVNLLSLGLKYTVLLLAVSSFNPKMALFFLILSEKLVTNSKRLD